jgi:hypothetical protein
MAVEVPPTHDSRLCGCNSELKTTDLIDCCVQRKQGDRCNVVNYDNVDKSVAAL